MLNHYSYKVDLIYIYIPKRERVRVKNKVSFANIKQIHLSLNLQGDM